MKFSTGFYHSDNYPCIILPGQLPQGQFLPHQVPLRTTIETYFELGRFESELPLKEANIATEDHWWCVTELQN